MNKQLARSAATFALAAALGVGASQAVQASGIGNVFGKAVKVGGIGFLVKQFGPEINKTINTLLQQKGVRYSGRTKVVPTFSVGNGAYVGAAQIQSDESQVDDAKYVGTVEVPLGRVRGRAYIPVRSLTKSGDALRRVKGVGVTALIDFRI